MKTPFKLVSFSAYERTSTKVRAVVNVEDAAQLPHVGYIVDKEYLDGLAQDVQAKGRPRRRVRYHDMVARLNSQVVEIRDLQNQLEESEHSNDLLRLRARSACEPLSENVTKEAVKAYADALFQATLLRVEGVSQELPGPVRVCTAAAIVSGDTVVNRVKIAEFRKLLAGKSNG